MIKSPMRFFVLLASLFAYSVQAQETESTMSVKGVGLVELANAEGRIQASVTTQNLDADVALNSNAIIMTNIINELNQVGIDSSSISTSRFDFNPQYDYVNGQRIFQGYKVTNGLNVKVMDVTAVGAVLNLLVDAGVTRINSVSFGSSALEEVRTLALQKASEDARTKASILAEANGVTLGDVISVELSTRHALSGPVTTGSVSSAPPTPIVPGSNVYSEQVLVTYELIR